MHAILAILVVLLLLSTSSKKEENDCTSDGSKSNDSTYNTTCDSRCV
jgi:hypothetical protein